MKKDDLLDLNNILSTQRFSYNPPRYTEASLVRKLEEMGIGRPSTYAPTISTIQNRGYVIKEDRDIATVEDIENLFERENYEGFVVSEYDRTLKKLTVNSSEASLIGSFPIDE